MNATMRKQTRQLLIKLGMILTCFILLASLLSTSIRYQKMLAATIANQETIVKNIFRMRIATKEAENTMVNFQRLLPTAYGTRSPDWLLYTRLDALKSRLQATEIIAKTIEHKEAFVQLGFSATVPLWEPATYSRIINLLGNQETLAFPFVTIHSISVDVASTTTQKGLKLQIEGSIQTPESQEKTP